MMHARIACEIFDVNFLDVKFKGKGMKTLEIEHIPPNADHSIGRFKLGRGDDGREALADTKNCLFETLSGGIGKSFCIKKSMFYKK